MESARGALCRERASTDPMWEGMRCWSRLLGVTSNQANVGQQGFKKRDQQVKRLRSRKKHLVEELQQVLGMLEHWVCEWWWVEKPSIPPCKVPLAEGIWPWGSHDSKQHLSRRLSTFPYLRFLFPFTPSSPYLKVHFIWVKYEVARLLSPRGFTFEWILFSIQTSAPRELGGI